jgi:iron uptake system component EfeO
MNLKTLAALAALATSSLLVTGCVAKNSSNVIAVSATDNECVVTTPTAASGTVTFQVTNGGSESTEFYILAEDGLRIVGEVENIGPGLKRDLVIEVTPGTYYTVCKPGMVGTGIGNAVFTVTDSGKRPNYSEDVEKLVQQAVSNYLAYVRNQTDALLTGTKEFAAAYTVGDFPKTRSLYAKTRMHWERIETAAESFGDLDPSMDAREADLEKGVEWTGWHAIEKDLWPQDAEAGFKNYSSAKRTSLAEKLVADTTTLRDRAKNMEFTLSQLTNGAIGLLDEVATGKVTGEEEIWSHTDLWDFKANVEGAQVLFDSVKEILSAKDSELAKRIETEFTAMNKLLAKHQLGDGYVTYDKLTNQQVRELSDQVNALAEPLNMLTASILK